jgi:deoxycytidine triphosphate deaminase
MILSDAGIKRALDLGELEISPRPQEDQYTTYAVDLFLGNVFQSWDEKVFKVPGTTAFLVHGRRFPDQIATREGWVVCPRAVPCITATGSCND